jgi:hypothetical protein
MIYLGYAALLQLHTTQEAEDRAFGKIGHIEKNASQDS